MTVPTWIEHLPVPTLLIERDAGRVTFANGAARGCTAAGSGLGLLDELLGPGATVATATAATKAPGPEPEPEPEPEPHPDTQEPIHEP